VQTVVAVDRVRRGGGHQAGITVRGPAPELPGLPGTRARTAPSPDEAAVCAAACRRDGAAGCRGDRDARRSWRTSSPHARAGTGGGARGDARGPRPPCVADVYPPGRGRLSPRIRSGARLPAHRVGAAGLLAAGRSARWTGGYCGVGRRSSHGARTRLSCRRFEQGTAGIQHAVVPVVVDVPAGSNNQTRWPPGVQRRGAAVVGGPPVRRGELRGGGANAPAGPGPRPSTRRAGTRKTGPDCAPHSRPGRGAPVRVISRPGNRRTARRGRRSRSGNARVVGSGAL